MVKTDNIGVAATSSRITSIEEEKKTDGEIFRGVPIAMTGSISAREGPKTMDVRCVEIPMEGSSVIAIAECTEDNSRIKGTEGEETLTGDNSKIETIGCSGIVAEMIAGDIDENNRLKCDGG